MGTDTGVGPHGSNAEELQRMVEAGMTPMQAIVATTKSAAWYDFNLAKRVLLEEACSCGRIASSSSPG